MQNLRSGKISLVNQRLIGKFGILHDNIGLI
jgi:hypothetical protein